MKATTLFILAVFLGYLSASNNIINEDPLLNVDYIPELPIEIQEYIFGEIQTVQVALMYAEILKKSPHSANLFSPSKEMEIIRDCMQQLSQYYGAERARLESAIGNIAVKLCLDRINNDLTHQSGENSEIIFRNLKYSVEYPNLKNTPPKVVAELINHVSQLINVPEKDLIDRLSIILLPFVRGNFLEWYEEWSDEDKMKYDELIKLTLLKAGKLVSFQRLGGILDESKCRIAIRYRCHEDDYIRLNILRNQISKFKLKILLKDYISACIYCDSANLLRNIFNEGHVLLSDLWEYACSAAQSSSPSSFKMILDKIYQSPSGNSSLTYVNHGILLRGVLSSGRPEILMETIKRKIFDFTRFSSLPLDPIKESSNLQMVKFIFELKNVDLTWINSKMSTYIKKAIGSARSELIEYLLQKDPKNPSNYLFKVSLDEDEWFSLVENIEYPSIEVFEYLFDPKGNSPIPHWPKFCQRFIKLFSSVGSGWEQGNEDLFIRREAVLKAILAEDTDGRLKYEYLADVDLNAEDLYRSCHPNVIPMFMKISRITGMPLFPQLDIEDHPNSLERLEVRASYYSMEVMGSKVGYPDANEVNLFENYLNGGDKIAELSRMCSFWNVNLLTSVYADSRFNGIDENAALVIAQSTSQIFLHFTSFNGSKPRYPTLSLPKDTLFTSRYLLLGNWDILDHCDEEGNLYFGLSLWNNDLHFLIYLATKLSENHTSTKAAVSIAQQVLRTSNNDNEFVLSEMSVDILEECLGRIREIPNVPMEYVSILEEKLLQMQSK